MSIQEVSRRGFVTIMGAGALGATAAALAGCAPQPPAEKASNADDTLAGTGASQADGWLGAAPEVSEDDIIATHEADLIVVGAGTGGLFTACSAAEEGASVIVLERAPQFGEVRNDLAGIGSSLQKEANVDVDVNHMIRDMIMYSAGDCNEKLYRLWAAHSGEAMDWYADRLAERGAKLWLEYATPNPVDSYEHYVVGHGAQFPSKELTGGIVLGEYAQSLGVEFFFETPMVKLDGDESGVSGVIAQNADGAFERFTARKGVVVSTGGYSANMEMLEALQPETLAITTITNGMPTYLGDGIKACLWAGAAFDANHSSMLQDRGAIPPDSKGGNISGEGGLLWLGSQPWMKVNLNGERFANESVPYDFIIREAEKQPEGAWFTLFDSAWQDAVVQFDTHGCSRIFPFENGAPGQFGYEVIGGMMQELLGNGYLVQADSIAELADKLGLPASVLEASVERYNAQCAAGADDDFGKEAYRMVPLDTPPYFGARQSGLILCTMDGITIDENCRAMTESGSAIDGLYVIGNDSGGYYGKMYPNPATGCAAGRTSTFGRLLGKRLANA